MNTGWGGLVLKAVMDVPSGWSEERRRRDERDRKRRQGSVKSVRRDDYSRKQYWEKAKQDPAPYISR
jgi:hypothetical protein